jgi:hypothetical protein
VGIAGGTALKPVVGRVVALGASNLAFGLGALVALSRAAWGREVQVVAALGLGRSYGAPSRVLGRTLPGILQSGLWRSLETLPPAPTRALVVDVGNDIMYAEPAGRIICWVGEALDRLRRWTRDITLTGLPLACVRRVSLGRYLLLRTIFFPGCRISRRQAIEAAAEVDAGLAGLAAARGVRWVRPDPSWYGNDPIHIRPAARAAAWQEILALPAVRPARCGWGEELALLCAPPERRWILAVERFTPQAGRVLAGGGAVRLY